MSIQIVERDSRLAEAADATLRLNYNRDNREFWYRASEVPLAAWPAWRDRELNRILDALIWGDIRSAPEGELIPVCRGMGTLFAVRSGGAFRFLCKSARGKWYPVEDVVWRPPAPIPVEVGYSVAELRRRWDERAQEARMTRLSHYHLDYDCRREWRAPAQAAAEAVLDAAAAGRWQDALSIARAYGAREPAGEHWHLDSAARYIAMLLAPAEATA